MPYILRNTTCLELIDKRNKEQVSLCDFEEVGERVLISKQSHQLDNKIWEAKFQTVHEGDIIILLVTYSEGEGGFEVEDVEIHSLPDHYEVLSLPVFEFLEDDDSN